MRTKVEIAALMYKCQSSAKVLFAEQYDEKILWYKDLIRACQKKHELEVLEAVMKLSNDDAVKENGMAVMFLMAAAVELIEPNSVA